jgi:hypothetical protein
MTDGDEAGAAPYASGGGGTVLEHHYGTVLLASLLTRAPIPDLGDDATPVYLRFQGRPVSPVDDLIVRGDTPDGERWVSIGVRRTPDFTSSDEHTEKLLRSYVKMAAERWEELRAGRWRLSLAVAKPSPAIDQVSQLTSIARAVADEPAFRAEVGRSVRVSDAVRNRLPHVDTLVTKAIAKTGPAAALIDPDVLTWRVLYSLRVRLLRLEDGDSADRTAAVDDLRRLTPDGTAAAGDYLFSQLAELASAYALNGAEVTRDKLYADLGIPLADRPSRGPVSAEAMLRGPVAHLGMAEQLAAADARNETDPAAAASGYAVVANALSSSPYAPHAAQIRARQADALRKAGDETRAVRAELAQMADALASGDPGQAISVAARLSHQQPDVPESLIRAVNALASVAAYEHDPQATLDAAAAQFDATEPDDPHRPLAATLLAEHAIAARRPDIVRARAAVLAGIAEATGHDDAGRLSGARLRACIADATGSWDALAGAAKRIYPRRVAALLLARHGRHLALTRRGEAAVSSYSDAIEQACEAGTYADATDWQFALRSIRINYAVGTLADIDDPYRLAQASRAAGDDSVIPELFSPLNLALSDLVDERLPDAVAALRRYRRRSVTLADWRAEHEARTRLGDVYVTAGQPVTAIDHYIAAGDTERLKKLPQQLPDEPLPLPIPDDLPSLPPWERAASFTIAGAAADLLTDSDATAWAELALAEFAATEPAPSLSVSPVLEACNAFGHLAAAATEEQARSFLDRTAPWLDRRPDQPRHSDPAHAEALIRIAAAHPGLRPDAVKQMCQAVLTDERMAGIILFDGTSHLRAESVIVASLCGPAAGGNSNAALAIILAGADPQYAEPVAQHTFDAITSAAPGSFTAADLGAGWQRPATLARALGPADRARLAEAMAVVVEDPQQSTWNKREALAGLATAGPDLRDHDRERFFPVALQAAGSDESGENEKIRGDPLHRIRTINPDTTLRYIGLLAAAALASGPGQAEEVIDLAYGLMPAANQTQAHRVAQALGLLPAEGQALLDVRALAAHESEWIRVRAAVLWCGSGGLPAQVGRRLAADPSWQVRRALASHLPDGAEYDPLRAVLRADVRRSVRTALRVPG